MASPSSEPASPTYPSHPGASFLSTTSRLPLPGRHLCLYEAGEGEDVVLLESGLGQGAAYWGLVVDCLLLAPSPRPVRIVAYDRAGYAGSSAANDARGVPELAADLLEVMAHIAPSARRIVLVGHSWGGPVLRAAAARLQQHPAGLGAKLAGLVLVDPTDEFAPFYFTSRMSWIFWIQSYLSLPMYYLGKLPKMTRAMLEPLPEPYMGAVVDGITRTAARATSYEITNFIGKLRWCEGQGNTDVGDTPVTIVSAGLAGELGQELRDELNAAHRRRVESVANGKFVLAEQSKHCVNINQPEIVAREALALVESASTAGA